MRPIAIASAAAALITAPYLLLPWYTRWGTRAEERREPLVGDGIVPCPRNGYTLGITIRAAPAEVWPWLVQMGQGRGGFYTHEWVENLLGADIHNADRIVPELQDLAVGEKVRLTPDPYLGLPGQTMNVAEVRPQRSLVYRQTLPSGGTGTWAFELRPQGPGGTRLLMRRRGSLPSLFDRVLVPGYVLMDRGVLRGLRRRAEALAAASANRRLFGFTADGGGQ